MPNILQLEQEKAQLEDRIKRLENDLKSPLDPDFHEQASQLSNQITLKRLLEVERANLHRVKVELDRLNAAQST
jgi:RNA polymerase-binding transcription factor DksA